MNHAPSIPASILAALALALPAAAAEFAAKGAQVVLTAEYVYTSSGRRADKYDSHEWQVQRTVNMRAELAAGAPTPLATQQAPDAAQQAAIGRQQAQGAKAAQAMAPQMAGIEAIMARCGTDQACLQRETMKMGFAMSGTPQLDDTLKTGRATAAAVQPGALRYQAFAATALSGRYQLEESARFVSADPICMERPGARCHRQEQRRGSGEVPPPSGAQKGRSAAGPAVAEIDSQAHTLWLRLPVPMNALPCTETVTSDMPGFQGSGVPRPCQRLFQVAQQVGPISVPLPAGAREASGEQTLAIAGTAGEGGQLRVRWRLVMP